MNLGDLANVGQVIGAIAVVVSLFYVANQIRQNTNAVRSATAQTVHEHFANWYHLIAADAELARIAANGLRDYASLSFRRGIPPPCRRRSDETNASPRRETARCLQHRSPFRIDVASSCYPPDEST